ncbi:MAG: putative oxidoreductase/Short-chain dehydrogenase [Labilithrix sp.]|nr:putative oxidoreductase/Short-chain dehydrogenase [Labilithrix sp.]
MSTTDTSLRGRNVIITGANTGIGRVTAEVLAKRGARVFLACRSEERTQPVIDAIRNTSGTAEFLPLDLGDLASVRAAAQRFLDLGIPLHILVNNAGVAALRGKTKDGFEMAFGTNHLGHFLFTTLLLPRLREAAPARIVNVASGAHNGAKGVAFDRLRDATATTTGFPEYQVSKLCIILFTTELANGRAGEGVSSYALHPGVIASDLWRHVPALFRPLLKLFMRTTAQGAESSIYCATSPEVAGQDGLYYNADCSVKKPSRPARDAALARELWERSEAWTKEHAASAS